MFQRSLYNLVEYTNRPNISGSRYWHLVPSLVLLILVACSSPSAPQVQLIGNQELIDLQATGNLQLVDVRTPEEITQGMIQGAENIDFRGKNFKEKMAMLDKDQPVVVYCADGNPQWKSQRDTIFNGVQGKFMI